VLPDEDQTLYNKLSKNDPNVNINNELKEVEISFSEYYSL
jgi:hypothetical protein